jgi:hypothetical protein
MLSRTFVRGLPAPTFFHHDTLVRGIDVVALLEKPLPPPRVLSPAGREHIVDAGRAILAALGRETDAIALAYPAGVEWHELGPRVVAVALYTMEPARRSPLDSHVGMMLFKNGIPVGYGGGWPFAGICRIGVNIFSPFRGGESALLFGQVLRVYRQRFAVARFVVEPSQFGGTNKEGLQSGAFWFYYRLGFRPMDARAARLAADEWSSMQANRAYRTEISALRRFTGSDIELRLREGPACEPADLSNAVTAWIAEHHAGDRDAGARSRARDRDSSGRPASMTRLGPSPSASHSASSRCSLRRSRTFDAGPPGKNARSFAGCARKAAMNSGSTNVSGGTDDYARRSPESRCPTQPDRCDE